MLPLGTAAADFRLPDPQGRMVGLHDLDDAPALLIIFMCNHCPYVIHLKRALAEFARQYMARGLAVVAINANDAEAYPQDSPAMMASDIAEFGYPFPYLIDKAQSVARGYRAACTPDFFLFDQSRQLVYRGQFDDSRPGNGRPITGADLRAAVEAVLEGRDVEGLQTPSMGCNIKWRPDNAPKGAD